MAKHIPFVYRKLDSQLANKIFGDSEVVRMPLQAGEMVRRSLPKTSKVWVDASVDRYHWPDAADVAAAKGMKTFTQITGGDKLGRPSFQETPETEIVDRFVAGVLEKCCELDADWVSVPQLPAVSNSSRNKVNRALASATAKWKAEARFKGALILPVIVTHQEQANLKGQRDKHKALARQCFERSGADGYWVVDSSLADWTGSRTFEQRRFKALVSFHEELREGLSSGFAIGGPYWALNLILWARGLVEYPAVGVGARYQYLLPGGTAMSPKRRVALSSLRRPAIVSPGLEKWLGGLPRTPELKEMRALLKDKHALRLDEAARAQVARFYKGWFDHLASVKPSGRALALFQDFSSAYVLGKSLDDLPSAEKTARRPERLAEQLMFSVCLRPSTPETLYAVHLEHRVGGGRRRARRNYRAASFVIDGEQAHTRTLEFFSSARKRDAFGNRSWERNVRCIGKPKMSGGLVQGFEGTRQLQFNCNDLALERFPAIELVDRSASWKGNEARSL